MGRGPRRGLSWVSRGGREGHFSIERKNQEKEANTKTCNNPQCTFAFWFGVWGDRVVDPRSRFKKIGECSFAVPSMQKERSCGATSAWGSPSSVWHHAPQVGRRGRGEGPPSPSPALVACGCPSHPSLLSPPRTHTQTGDSQLVPPSPPPPPPKIKKGAAGQSQGQNGLEQQPLEGRRPLGAELRGGVPAVLGCPRVVLGLADA